MIDAAGGTIGTPLVVILILWLAIIFAGIGYGAPRHTIVTASFFLAALLISASLYLILDMDASTSGMFKASKIPFQRALAQGQR